MSRISYASPLLLALVLGAAPPAFADQGDVGPGMKAYKLQLCDEGAFRRRAWNEEFGRVEFLTPDTMRATKGETGRDTIKVRCITRQNLARLKARQGPNLRVIDPNERGR